MKIIHDNEDHFNNIENVFYDDGRHIPCSGFVHKTRKEVDKI